MKLIIKSTLKKMALPLGAIILLSGCVAPEGPSGSYPPIRPQPPQMCTMEYMPVCAVRGNRQKTFANRCTAQADGYQVIRQGQCNSQNGNQNKPQRPPHSQRPDRPNHGGNWNNDSWGSGSSVPSRPSNRPDMNRPDNRPTTSTKACTRDYRPVCATRGRESRTFSNSCMAENEGFRPMHNGQCR